MAHTYGRRGRRTSAPISCLLGAAHALPAPVAGWHPWFRRRPRPQFTGSRMIVRAQRRLGGGGRPLRRAGQVLPRHLGRARPSRLLGDWAGNPGAGRRGAGRAAGRAAAPEARAGGVRHRLRLWRDRADAGRGIWRRRHRGDDFGCAGGDRDRRAPSRPAGSISAGRTGCTTTSPMPASTAPSGGKLRAYAGQARCSSARRSAPCAPAGRLVVCAWLPARPAGVGGAPSAGADLPRGPPARPWATRPTTRRCCRQAGFELLQVDDISRSVGADLGDLPAPAGRARRSPTGGICGSCWTRMRGNRVFALTMVRLLVAYRTGSMRYCVLTARKPAGGEEGRALPWTRRRAQRAFGTTGSGPLDPAT